MKKPYSAVPAGTCWLSSNCPKPCPGRKAKAADRLGVVYTPNEIVRFMVKSADQFDALVGGRQPLAKLIQGKRKIDGRRRCCADRYRLILVFGHG